jgi:capsular polysaccharide biosynthesis protein
MKALLIPSALLVPPDMRNKFGELPTALFPLGNKTMIERLYDKYKDIVDIIYIVVKRKQLLINDYINSKKLPIRIIELDELRDLGYTIQYGIEFIIRQEPSVDYVYVNFADSLLDEPIPVDNNDFIYYVTGMSTDEWTYFREKQGKIEIILDKCLVGGGDTSLGDVSNIFVGVFGFTNPHYFLELLKQYSNVQSDMDTFYQAIFTYSQEYPFTILHSQNWFDVGHSDNYSKATTSVAARSFNSIEIDEQRGILKKRSENKEKLVNEIRWYLRIPNKLQYLLPRVYDYSLDLTDPYVSMEYYGYHTLHESLVFGDLPLVKWQAIFQKLLFAINDMGKFTVTGERIQFEAALRDIYLQKTFDRLDMMRNEPDFHSFFENTITINGKEYRSLNEYLKMLPQLIEKLVVYTFTGQFNIIHGDLCFANILIEDTYDFIRVIDPRGKFGTFDIYGDGRYELAKLMHTLEGKYDFIIEDMFDIDVIGNTIEYHVHKQIDNITNVFLDVFRESIDNIQAVRLIEATLFLSMIPLHSDYKQRQFAMLATGVMLLEQVIREIEG